MGSLARSNRTCHRSQEMALNTTSKTAGRKAPQVVFDAAQVDRLEALAVGAMPRAPELADRLLGELTRGKIVPTAKLPPNVVTIGSEVTYRDEFDRPRADCRSRASPGRRHCAATRLGSDAYRGRADRTDRRRAVSLGNPRRADPPPDRDARAAVIPDDREELTAHACGVRSNGNPPGRSAPGDTPMTSRAPI